MKYDQIIINSYTNILCDIRSIWSFSLIRINFTGVSVTDNNKSKTLFKEKCITILLKRCLIKRLLNVLLDNVKNMRNYTITLFFVL